MWKFCICVAVLASAGAFAEDSIHIRPQAGSGNLDSDNYRHAGLTVDF